jgi:hypothetical protein
VRLLHKLQEAVILVIDLEIKNKLKPSGRII